MGFAIGNRNKGGQVSMQQWLDYPGMIFKTSE
jgi:hypothetical protein